MPHYLFDLYSAFTDSAFGGSHAGIIYDGEGPVSYTHLTLPTNREV